MLIYTFRNVVEDIRTGRTNHLAVGTEYNAGDILLIVSGRPSIHPNHIEPQPDENPIRAIVEVSKVEPGPPGYKHFICWERLVFGAETLTCRAEVAFDREGNPRYDRSVAIHKQIDEKTERIRVVDLNDGEVLTTNLKRLSEVAQQGGEAGETSGD